MEQLSNNQICDLAMKAIYYAHNGELDRAQTMFQELAKLGNTDLKVLLHLGDLAINVGENQRAVDFFKQVVSQKPDNSDYVFLLANALTSAGQLDQAEEMLRKAIALNPKSPGPHARLGVYLNTIGNHYEAIELLETAVQLKPKIPEPYFYLVLALRSVNRHEQALEYAHKMVRLKPDAANYASLARTLIEMGETKEATIHLNKAIALDKKYGISYYDLSTIKKYSEDDSAFINKTEKVLQHNMPSYERSHIHFALGKMYNDCKQWEKAFEHFKQGNNLAKISKEPDHDRMLFKKIKDIYSKKLIKQANDLGHHSETPVFIVGMPRSGTSLFEQIIASHPVGAGAGELNEIRLIENDIFRELESSSNSINNVLSKDYIEKHAKSYLNRLSENQHEASRIVDKAPDNFLFLGLIHLMFPRAHIIHAIRNPLDVCLSCYFQNFRQVPMSFDLTWLANAYRFYRNAMDHWKKALPENTIVDVCYEDMIKSPQTEMQRLIEACNLQWDPACLEFYNTPRAVITTSLWQVRQPIYTSSSRRWTHYIDHLGELAYQLRDYLDDDDIATLKQHGIKMGGPFKLNIFK